MCSLTLKKLAFTTVEVKKKIKHKTHRAQTHFKMQAFSQRQGDKGKIPKKKFSYYQLSDSQVSVLSKCLKLIPTSGTIECKIRRQLMRDFEQFARRMRLYVFHGKTKNHTLSRSKCPPYLNQMQHGHFIMFTAHFALH